MTRGRSLVPLVGLMAALAFCLSYVPASGQISLSGYKPKLEGDFSETDMWRLVAVHAQQQVATDMADGEDPRWTPEARAVYELIVDSNPSAKGVERVLARYLREANADAGQGGETEERLRLALPAPGLYPASVERLLSLIEGSHLWRSRGREKLATTAADEALALAATLSDQELDLDEAVRAALVAPVHYVATYPEFPAEAYWPSLGQIPSDLQSPRTTRWIRSAWVAEDNQESGDNPPVTRRVGGNNARWWPAYQEAYLDLAYRGLPELLRRRLAAPGELGVFRVWHAGFEDGSQTFLLAALLDEAFALLSADSDLADEAAAELSSLRLEIIATDYAYMPSRDGPIYRFDAAGSQHHKWNLILEESALANDDAGLVNRLTDQHEQVLAAATAAERQVLFRQLADQGLAGALLGRFLTLAPEIEVPLSLWVQPDPRGFVKHAYRLIDRRWKVVELHEGKANELFNRDARDRLIRFEQGDMTETLPSGFEGGAFDLVVVTNVLPYIYNYYRQQGEKRRPASEGKTPMERAQDNVLLAARSGAWVLMDEYTEQQALDTSRRDLASKNRDFEPWTRSWATWVRSLKKKQVELYLTLESGAELRPSSGYQTLFLGMEALKRSAYREADKYLTEAVAENEDPGRQRAEVAEAIADAKLDWLGDLLPRLKASREAPDLDETAEGLHFLGRWLSDERYSLEQNRIQETLSEVTALQQAAARKPTD